MERVWIPGRNEVEPRNLTNKKIFWRGSFDRTDLNGMLDPGIQHGHYLESIYKVMSLNSENGALL